MALKVDYHRGTKVVYLASLAWPALVYLVYLAKGVLVSLVHLVYLATPKDLFLLLFSSHLMVGW